MSDDITAVYVGGNFVYFCQTVIPFSEKWKDFGLLMHILDEDAFTCHLFTSSRLKPFSIIPPRKQLYFDLEPTSLYNLCSESFSFWDQIWYEVMFISNVHRLWIIAEDNKVEFRVFLNVWIPFNYTAVLEMAQKVIDWGVVTC